MADNHSLNYDVRELKLGASFTNNKASQYHTIKYDFKPASVDVNKMATVDVGTNHQVTVTVPHLDGAGVPQTVFKGNQRPYTKECVLIIDRVTGEITLEKLSSNIQVKKTRQENTQKPRPLTPVTTDFTNTTQRSTSRTRVATNRRTANPNTVAAAAQAHSQAARFNGGGASMSKTGMVRSPPRVKTSPPQAAPWSGGGNSTLASLPMIGLDEALGAPAPAHNGHARPERPERSERPERPDRPERSDRPERPDRPERSERPERQYPAERERPQHSQAPPSLEPLNHAHHAAISNVPPPQPPPAPPQDDSSSSSSSDSDSGSGSDSDSDDNEPAMPQHTLTNGTANPLPTDVLNDDLCLSESCSDSD